MVVFLTNHRDCEDGKTERPLVDSTGQLGKKNLCVTVVKKKVALRVYLALTVAFTSNIF